MLEMDGSMKTAHYNSSAAEGTTKITRVWGGDLPCNLIDPATGEL
jgi:peptidoglycan hydrolase-like amidase